MSWLSSESHKLCQDLGIGMAIFADEIKKFVKGLFEEKVGELIERRHGERRNIMPEKLSELLKDAKLVESLAPEIEGVWKAIDALWEAYLAQKNSTSGTAPTA